MKTWESQKIYCSDSLWSAKSLENCIKHTCMCPAPHPEEWGGTAPKHLKIPHLLKWVPSSNKQHVWDNRVNKFSVWTIENLSLVMYKGRFCDSLKIVFRVYRKLIMWTTIANGLLASMVHLNLDYNKTLLQQTNLGSPLTLCYWDSTV